MYLFNEKIFVPLKLFQLVGVLSKIYYFCNFFKHE